MLNDFGGVCHPSPSSGHRGYMFFHEDGEADSSRNFAKCLPDNTGEHPGRPQLHISIASIPLTLSYASKSVLMRRS